MAAGGRCMCAHTEGACGASLPDTAHATQSHWRALRDRKCRSPQAPPFFRSVNLADPRTQHRSFHNTSGGASHASRQPAVPSAVNRCVRLRLPPLCTRLLCLCSPWFPLRPKMILRHLSDYGGVPARSEPSAASSRKTPSCLSSLPRHHARSPLFRLVS